MRLKTYRAYSLQEAIEAVQRDLGPDAMILHTRSYSKRGLFQLLRRNIVEVIASDAEEKPEPEGLLRHVLPNEVAAGRAYRTNSVSNDEDPSEPDEAPGEILDIDSTRTRRLAQALSVRQERIDQSESARQPAVVNLDSDSSDVMSPRRYVVNAEGDLTAEIREPVEVIDDAVEEFEPTVSEPANDSELDAIRATVGRVIETDGLPRIKSEEAVNDTLADAYTNLISQELSRELADKLVEELAQELPEEVLANSEMVRDAVLDRLAALVPTSETTSTPQPIDGRPWTIAFVGPTGVGKTTTLAKVASTLTLKQGRRVGLVTADTYRVAAVDQLRTYADILSIPLAVANGASEMGGALQELSDCEIVLLDTPGRSQNDADQLMELRSIIDIANPHEIHLVLSSTASERVLMREAEAFADLRPDRIVLTKLDEAVSFGMLVSVVRRIGRRLSWVTTGQEVPADIEQATGRRIADMMLGGVVKA